jgi:hypothetical protein
MITRARYRSRSLKRWEELRRREIIKSNKRWEKITGKKAKANGGVPKDRLQHNTSSVQQAG